MKLYEELAGWWPVLRPPRQARRSARALLAAFQAAAEGPFQSLLELGSGSGNIAANLPEELEVVLVDRSAAMLEISRQLNPGRQHVEADIRSVCLGRFFDGVLLHDAVMYLTGDGDLEAALRTAGDHLRPGGLVAVVPDTLAGTFEERSLSARMEQPDGRAAVLTEWHWDPTAGDGLYNVEFSILIREPGQPVRAVHETHPMLLLEGGQLWQALKAAGFSPVEADPRAAAAAGALFLARKP